MLIFLLVCPGAKVMVPEREQPLTAAGGHALVEREAINVFDAAAHGAVAGMRLAAYVGAMLIAFVALIALVNEGLAAVGTPLGIEGLSLQRLLGFFSVCDRRLEGRDTRVRR